MHFSQAAVYSLLQAASEISSRGDSRDRDVNVFVQRRFVFFAAHWYFTFRGSCSDVGYFVSFLVSLYLFITCTFNLQKHFSAYHSLGKNEYFLTLKYGLYYNALLFGFGCECCIGVCVQHGSIKFF